MKRALLLALAVSLPGAAAAQTLTAQPLTVLDDKRLPFTLQLPKNWYGFKAEDGAQGVSVVSAQKPPATLMRFLFLNKGGKNADLGTEFRNFEAGVKGSGGSLRLIGGKNSTYGGVRGAERVYALGHSGGELRMRVWFGNGAKNLYSFQVTDSASRFAKSDALFKRVLGTVRFR
ncbi:hypothetical protein F8S09_00985 [Deinococcus sp. SDU3-2]|uniref:DUF1795 domain-containing protein n=1 Tax=Deinococcus terrestris TaxID=2651870 RepID=A0A7X1NTB1_9DEIO|nr:hypothetical protein [Deinococcus terrestris]MPY65270.1 hypothetical protein [Deinococcus terrestris]